VADISHYLAVTRAQAVRVPRQKRPTSTRDQMAFSAKEGTPNYHQDRSVISLTRRKQDFPASLLLTAGDHAGPFFIPISHPSPLSFRLNKGKQSK
jgi:hypothetical protein